MGQCQETWADRTCELESEHVGPHYDLHLGDWGNVQDKINALLQEAVSALEEMGYEIQYQRWAHIQDQIDRKCRVVVEWAIDDIVPLLSGCKTGEEMSKLLIGIGSDPSGQGTFRTVFDLGDSVLKIDRRSENNEREIKLWEAVKDTEDARYFGAISAHDPAFRWLIMEKVEVGCGPYLPPEDFDRVMDKYEVSDMHAANYGQRADGSICAIDYGFNMFGTW